jgi:hypothetical protein
LEPRRRYLTFSLRTLFILLTLFAVWTATIVNRAREQREAVKAIEALGGAVVYDWQGPPGSRLGKTGPPAPAWLRQLVGDDYFQQATSVNFARLFADTPGGYIEPLPHLRDEDIKALIPSLRQLRRLESIWTFNDVSAATLRELEDTLPGVDIQNYY